jgi:hypothetical protein
MQKLSLQNKHSMPPWENALKRAVHISKNIIKAAFSEKSGLYDVWCIQVQEYHPAP